MQMGHPFTDSTFIFSKVNGIIYILHLVDFLTNELDLRDDCFPPNNWANSCPCSSINFAVHAKGMQYKRKKKLKKQSTPFIILIKMTCYAIYICFHHHMHQQDSSSSANPRQTIQNPTEWWFLKRR